jgi:hypothetical protein
VNELERAAVARTGVVDAIEPAQQLCAVAVSGGCIQTPEGVTPGVSLIAW